MDELESEEEAIVSGGSRLVGSMVGRRRILTMWAVGEEWEIFSQERSVVVRRYFRILRLALPIDGSCDGEISIKGIENAYLQEGLKDWSVGGVEDFDSEEDEESAGAVGVEAGEEAEAVAEEEGIFYGGGL